MTTVTAIERAPADLPELEARRAEAKARLEEWRQKGETDDEIIKSGYMWRKRTRNEQVDLAHRAWDWAVWEEIQMLAAERGYEYCDELTVEDIFDDPHMPDPEWILDDPRYQRAGSRADEAVTNWRNVNNANALLRFIKSGDGQVWREMSLWRLWRGVKANGGRTVRGNCTGADRHFDEFAPFPGMAALLTAMSWAEALATEVTVYRGVTITRYNENPRHRPLVSYTTSPQIARLFAEGYYENCNRPGQGKVLERRVHLGDILGYVNPDGEFEVLLAPARSGGKCDKEA